MPNRTRNARRGDTISSKGIHGVRNYRKAWSEARTQVMIRLNVLMTCQRFELIAVHIITGGPQPLSVH